MGRRRRCAAWYPPRRLQLAPQLLGANLTDATRQAITHAASAA
jgi:hypothetical protein